MPSILESIENKGLDLRKTEWYAVIIGESPSKGAKSPSLWNRAFSDMGIPGFMHPMDVRPEMLIEVIQNLKSDKRFIGGAVTMPYKISIINCLDALEPEAERIGAVNCIYREGDKLIGSNTDGAGALWSLKKEMSDNLSGKTALLLGTGGAGFAVASYLASAIGLKGCLKLANRSNRLRDELMERLKDQCRIKPVGWPPSRDDVKDLDILVNCTSIGFETLKEDSNGFFTHKFYTPLGPVDNTIRVNNIKNADKLYLKTACHAINSNIGNSLEVLSSMDDPLIFDIIYQPLQTMLLSLARIVGYRILNGAPMNLEQAVIAFKKATYVSGLCRADNDEIRNSMRKVW